MLISHWDVRKCGCLLWGEGHSEGLHNKEKNGCCIFWTKYINSTPLSLVGTLGYLTWVRHSSWQEQHYMYLTCVQYFSVSKQWYGCQLWGFLTFSQMCTWGLHRHCRRVCSTVENWLVETSLATPATRTFPWQYCVWLACSVGHSSLNQLSYPHPCL